MKILFIHQNFPGQFKFLAPALVKAGHQVVAMPMARKAPYVWEGVAAVPYAPSRGSTAGIHPWVGDFETKVIRADACFHAALRLRAQGFTPDVVVSHHGWGESLFLKQVWPQARLGVYCEFYYRETGADTGFDPEFSSDQPGDACRLRLKNLNNLLHFETADAGLSPTHWQASTFPEPFRSRISVIHDGIDTRALAPDPNARFTFTDSNGLERSFSRDDEVVTFVNRNLEPYRGYHTFMRALPDLLRRRPQAQILLVGGDGVSYGARPDPARHGEGSWKDIYIREVRPLISDLDWARVHFLGNLPYSSFIPLLQVSRVHVYLTYPFVLSWSLLEAMSLGCTIVASDTQPLREAIVEGSTGRLVDFFDPAALSRTVDELLSDPDQRAALSEAARAHACAQYDLHDVCLPRQLQWVHGLSEGRLPTI